MKKGDTYEQIINVEEKDSAKNLGSGSLNVFGTPAMIALMENTCLSMLKDSLEKGQDTVGIAIHAKHLKASPIGAKIKCKAEIVDIADRKISYQVWAWDEKEDLIGTATHERFIINTEKFLSKLS